jgi:D-3-phosphoglycerate dehydrogenase
VSYISAPAVAADRGVKVTESAQARARAGLRQLLTVSAKTDRGAVSVAGALIAPGEPRVVLLNDLAVEVRPEGKLLVVTNRDTPGVIGRIGTLLGENQINIADMRVGRMAPHGEAVMVLTVDEEASAPVRAKLEQIPGITSVRWVKL